MPDPVVGMEAPEGPKQPKKRLDGVKVTMLCVAVFLCLFLAVRLISFFVFGSASARYTSSPTSAKQPTSASPEDVQGYTARTKAEADSLKQAQQANDDTQKMLEAQRKLVQQAQAHEAPGLESDGIPPLTDAQKAAMYGESGQTTTGQSATTGDGTQQGGGHTSSGTSARHLSKRERLQAALDSPALVIDVQQPQPQPQAATGDDAPHERSVVATQNQPASPPGVSGTPTAKYDWDQYDGKLYRIFEGCCFDAVLVNRINGSFAGPLDAMITTDYYSQDHQVLLIPQGTRVLGDVTAVSGTNQQRLFVSFHRMIMPDGFSYDLNKFTGLNVQGETGLRDLVNHHYLSIFGASLAIAGIGAVAQAGSGYSGIGYDPSIAIRQGISQQMGQEAMQILDRFLNQLPTFIVRERTRLKIYRVNDMLVPDYTKHRVPGDI